VTAVRSGFSAAQTVVRERKTTTSSHWLRPTMGNFICCVKINLDMLRYPLFRPQALLPCPNLVHIIASSRAASQKKLNAFNFFRHARQVRRLFDSLCHCGWWMEQLIIVVLVVSTHPTKVMIRLQVIEYICVCVFFVICCQHWHNKQWIALLSIVPRSRQKRSSTHPWTHPTWGASTSPPASYNACSLRCR